jgi:hypothetical protein
MVATHKYREFMTYRLTKERPDSVSMQQIVVNNYALSILVIRLQTHLLKDNDLNRITKSHRDRSTT